MCWKCTAISDFVLSKMRLACNFRNPFDAWTRETHNLGMFENYYRIYWAFNLFTCRVNCGFRCIDDRCRVVENYFLWQTPYRRKRISANAKNASSQFSVIFTIRLFLCIKVWFLRACFFSVWRETIVNASRKLNSVHY